MIKGREQKWFRMSCSHCWQSEANDQEKSTSLYKSLLTGCGVTQNLNQDIVVLMQIRNTNSSKSDTWMHYSVYNLLTWPCYCWLKEPIWVLFPQNLSDNQTLSNVGHGGFHVTLSSIYQHAWWRSLLFLVALCKTKRNRHSFLNHWKILENGGHNH